MKGVRVAVAALTLSAAGYLGIAIREDYAQDAMIPTKGDVPTLGFGQTEHSDGSPVRMGEHTTPVRALRDSIEQIDSKYERSVKTCIHEPLTQEEFDAYVKLAYNIGPSAFCSSTIVKRANARDYAGACNAILMWKMYQGTDCSRPNKVCAGLWKDRLQLHAQCVAAQ